MKALIREVTFYNLPHMFVILFIHLVAIRAMGRAHHIGNETDHAALLAIKSQLVDDPDGVLSSWNRSFHHCSWEGVTCGRIHNRVTVLDLNSHGLAGLISPFIGNLSFLRDLELYNNSLVGPIPSELGRLFRLQTLRLFNNTLSGGLPASLSACINLRKLSVGRNKLEGTFPMEFRTLSKLTFLSIHSNTLTGQLFQVIANLTSLEIINVFDNLFRGNIPTSIGQMQNLTSLGADGNEFSGSIPTSILNCTFFERLEVADNKFHGELPPDIGLKLPHLLSLDLFSNQFFGAFPNSVVNLTRFNFLGLGSNNFTGRVPLDFGHLHNLWCLELSDNHLEGDINVIGSLVNCSKLESLLLMHNEFTGVLPESIANLSTSLRILRLDFNGIEGEIPVGITNLIKLQTISFQGNEMRGFIPRDIGKLQNLELLYLLENRFTGSIPDTLGNLSRLSKVLLNDNLLVGNIPRSLGTCRSLLDLDLAYNFLNGTLVEELFAGPAMFIGVDLSNNLLTGSLPSEISKQVNLVEFYVWNNKFSGIIPYGLGQCYALQKLDIHDNLFHGYIPSSFRSLRSLQAVDLSENNLSGTIPNYFSKFPLRLLNLSYNDFEGRVPTTGVFANLSAIAVKGNMKLCGGIPKLHLPKCIQPNERKKRRKISEALKLTVSIICALVGVLIIATLLYLACRKKKKEPASSGFMTKSYMKVSYDMLLKATNGFSSENLVGVGSFGSVFKGTLDGETIAVKVLDLQTRGASKTFMAECKALRNIRHRNLVGIITTCSSIDYQRNVFKALVYEFMPNGSLGGWLHRDEAQKHTLSQRVNIAIDVAHALNYLHNDCEIPIVHCDLKPTNILLDNDMIARVGDFGLAKFLAQSRHSNQSSSIGIRGTIGYASPEYGVGSEPSPDGDVYSYGVLVLEMMTGKRPTDNMFHEDYNLHKYVKAGLPRNVLQVIDPSLEHNDVTEELDDEREIHAIAQRRLECMVAVLSVGVACSEHLPKDRMKISDVLGKLRVARDNLRNARPRSNFPRGGRSSNEASSSHHT